MKTKKKKALRIILVAVAVVLLVMIGGFYIYTLDYYRADLSAADAEAVAVMAVEQESLRSDLTVFKPLPEKDIKTGLIFYPGGKVADDAYAPLMARLAEDGITCVLVKMPFNLAVFNVNAADGIFELLPDVETWYIGGHSLGGAMASSYAGNAARSYTEKAADSNTALVGLILLAAYPVNDAGIPTLAIYGSEDGLLDRSKLTGVQNVMEITGGNHAYFGNYGEQKGDGAAAITREEQQVQTVAAIVAFIEEYDAQ